MKIIYVVLYNLFEKIKKSNADIIIKEMPILICRSNEIRILFLNLIYHALKYKSSNKDLSFIIRSAKSQVLFNSVSRIMVFVKIDKKLFSTPFLNYITRQNLKVQVSNLTAIKKSSITTKVKYGWSPKNIMAANFIFP